MAGEIAYALAVAIQQARLQEELQLHTQHIEASLNEKEVLLQEIHHRVKNNMQVISSLLNLQAAYVDDPQALEILQESQNRVRSMALVHEKLYRSANLAEINFAEYVRDLAGYLRRAQAADVTRIRLDINAADVFLGVDAAVPCGLIINELVTNSLKHAFPNGRSGKICIELAALDTEYVLVIEDNGVGLPPHLDIQNTETLGLQLVDTLIDQLDGSLELENTGGVKFTIKFPKA